MTLDLTLIPLYRIHGKEPASLPGLAAASPPRKPARGREQDSLAVQLLLTGTATFTVDEYAALATLASERFHQTAGPVTSALRASAEAVNASLLERNMATSGRGQYAVGWLALVATREVHCTLLLSGPMHAFILGGQNRHIHEPLFSGRGLGVAQSPKHYFTQAELKPGENILLTGKVPSAWETTLADASPAAPVDVLRRRLLGLTGEDLHAILIHVTKGTGKVAFTGALGLAVPELKKHAERGHPEVPAPARETLPQPEPAPAAAAPEPEPVPGPPVSAYAIPPQAETSMPAPPAPVQPPAPEREFPPSIPRLKPRAETAVEVAGLALPEQPAAEVEAPAPEIARPRREKAPRAPKAPREPSPATRRAAKTAVGGMQAWRRTTARWNDGLRNFLPRLVPGGSDGDSGALPPYAMAFIALVIPILVVTAAMVMYLRYGRSAQYENYLAQAQTARAQAASLTDAIMQRDAWQSVLLYVDKAESYRDTDATDALRREAEGNLDELLGVLRLGFQPAFSTGLGIQISRMAATDDDLYMMDARTGEILRAQLTGRGFVRDTAFNCKPGSYRDYQVGPLVDILPMPLLNSIDATVVGVDAGGNLLYCAPGQVPQAIPLPPPDTNWGRVTAIAMDAGNLYVLDAPSRAVWVYSGKDGAFVDRPYFFFTEQIPQIQDGIDLVVKDDSLYLLHSDGHLSTCSYSRIATVPTRCQDPAALMNPFAAYKDTDLFAQAHITQMTYSAPPDSTILLLGADSQGVLRLTPASLELQNQIRPAAGKSNPLPSAPIDAMTAGPNHVLYLAIKDQVYFATDMP